MRGAALFLLLTGFAALAAEPPEAKREAAAKTISPKRLFRRRCSTCHGPARVFHREAGRREWREIVNRMRRMPQSGISPSDADIIVDYLVSLRGKQGRKKALPAKPADWLSILETAPVRAGKVRIGRRTYGVKTVGDQFELSEGKKTHRIRATAKGRASQTALVDSWRVGKVTYEVHLFVLDARPQRVRVGLGLRRID